MWLLWILTDWRLERKFIECLQMLTTIKVPFTNTLCTSCRNNRRQIGADCLWTEAYTRKSTGECEKCPPNTIASGEFQVDGIINNDNSYKPCAKSYITQSSRVVEFYKCNCCREDSYLLKGTPWCVACPFGFKRMHQARLESGKPMYFNWPSV